MFAVSWGKIGLFQFFRRRLNGPSPSAALAQNTARKEPLFRKQCVPKSRESRERVASADGSAAYLRCRLMISR